MKRWRRPLWTYRPPLCMVGLHVTSTRRVPRSVPRVTPGFGKIYHTEYHLIAECDRAGCCHSRMLS